MRLLSVEAGTSRLSAGRVLFPCLVAAAFLALSIAEARFKLLTEGELVTYWVGQQQSFAGIWRVLLRGAYPHPPLAPVLNWASTAVFGSVPLAIRLPSIVGVGFGVVSLWLLLRRYLSPVYAAAGCLSFMATPAFDYTYDAGPYGLLMGFTMAALWLRTLAAGRTGLLRAFWLAGLAGTLAGAVSSSLYGVLAILVVGIAEGTNWRASRRLRTGTWWAIGAGALPVLAYLRLVRFGLQSSNRPHLSVVPESYRLLMGGICWPVLALALFSLWKRRRPDSAAAPVPLHLSAWVGALLLYPLSGFLVAWAGGGPMGAGGVALLTFGVAIAGASLLQRVASRGWALGAVAVLLIAIGAREAACTYRFRQQKHAFLHLRDAVERAAAPGEPVVVTDPLLVLPLHWYGSAALRQQLVFPSATPPIRPTEPDTRGEQGLWGGREGVFPVPLTSTAALFQADTESVLVGDPHGWLAEDLARRGCHQQESETNVAWDQLGGVSTPLAHPGTRIFFAAVPQLGSSRPKQ